MDFLKQRRRWVQGTCLAAKNPDFPLRVRWLLFISTRFWLLTPLNTILFCGMWLNCHLTGTQFVSTLPQKYYGATFLWMYVFGACYNFSTENRLNYIARVVMTGVCAPLFGMIE